MTPVNGNVFRIDELLKNMSKPTIIEAGEIDFDSEDCLIVCGGFEDRSTHIIEALSTCGKDLSVILINYLPFLEENRSQTIRDKCAARNIELFEPEIEYDRENPAGVIDSLLPLISKVNRRIFIDISGMSRLLIVQLIVGLYRHKGNFNGLSILYCMADEYPLKKEQVRQKIDDVNKGSVDDILILSTGVFDISIVPELSSTVMQSQPIRLIAFPSFNNHQLTTLRAELSVANFSFISGRPYLQETYWHEAEIRKLNRVEEIIAGNPSNTDESKCTLNYIETLDYLLDLYNDYNIWNKLVLAPTGSKMQAVAVGIFRSFLDDVQIVYPTPRTFDAPDRFSIGVQKVYRLDLDDFSVLA